MYLLSVLLIGPKYKYILKDILSTFTAICTSLEINLFLTIWKNFFETLTNKPDWNFSDSLSWKCWDSKKIWSQSELKISKMIFFYSECFCIQKFLKTTWAVNVYIISIWNKLHYLSWKRQNLYTKTFVRCNFVFEEPKLKHETLKTGLGMYSN